MVYSYQKDNMKIGHFSDLHGRYEILEKIPDESLPDVWLNTGDFFPNFVYGDRGRDAECQVKWFGHKYESIVSRLRGRPLLSIDGNHDFVRLGSLMKGRGYFAQNITPEGLEFGGLKFAGFHQIPFIGGYWNGEIQQDEFKPLVEKVFEFKPDILVTHAPPSGILDAGISSAGSSILTSKLTHNTEPNPRFHFFGHIHECSGRQIELTGTTFVNSACCIQIIDVT